MRQFQERCRRAWAERRPRERWFLIALAAFVAGALLVQGIWTARTESARLRKQIPQLRLQAEAMQRQAGEIRQLQAQGRPAAATAVEGAALVTAAAASAKAGGLNLTASQVQLEGPRQLRLRASLPFDRWLEWTATLQLELRLRLTSCQIESTESPGLVRIDALFALPDPG